MKFRRSPTVWVRFIRATILESRRGIQTRQRATIAEMPKGTVRSGRTLCHPQDGPVRWWSVSSDRRRNERWRSLAPEGAMVALLVPEQRHGWKKSPPGQETRPAFRLAAQTRTRAQRTQGRRRRVGCRSPRSPFAAWRRSPRPCASRRAALPAVPAGRRGWKAGPDCSTSAFVSAERREYFLNFFCYPALISDRTCAWAGSS
jgi:hypothetical protein